MSCLDLQSETLILTSDETHERIDKLLARCYPNFSRTYFQHLLDEGFVLINGTIAKKRDIPEVGDEIEVCFQLTPESPLTPEKIPLEILFEDEYLLVINKPAGMVVHPGPGHRSGTFVNALLAHCQDLLGTDPVRPGIVHRLDKDTSGLLLAAKTPLAHQRLVQIFSEQKIEKTYLALCSGRPPGGLINAPIGRHPVHRKEMTVSSTGKTAISDIQVLAFNDTISLVMIRPKTGRTHQIRVHLKHLGHPILGDAVYGGSRSAALAKRQLLHAYRLQLHHPITGEPLAFCAPIPSDMKEWIQDLK